MKNPYRAPPEPPRRDKFGNIMFFRFNKCRWTFFEASGGELWWSGERMKFMHNYCRDYTRGVFKRYVRRFGVLSPEKALRFELKVARRWDWFSHAQIGYSFDMAFPGNGLEMAYYESDGEFCPIGVPISSYSGISDLRTDQIERYLETPKCELCGSDLKVKKGAVLPAGVEITRLFFIRPDYREYVGGPAVVAHECTDSKCLKTRLLLYEASEFMNGRHRLIDQAKKLHVPMKRPIRGFHQLPDDEKCLVASAALLDFEARFYEKKSALEKKTPQLQVGC